MKTKISLCISVMLVAIYAAVEAAAVDYIIWEIQSSPDYNYIWMATSKGLARYDIKSDEIAFYTDPYFSGISQIAVSPEGKVAVGGATGKGQIAIFENGTFNFCGLEDNKVVSGLSFDNGLWYGTSPNIGYQIDGQWKSAVYEPALIAPMHLYRSFAFDSSTGRMWYGTQGAGSLNPCGWFDAKAAEFHPVKFPQGEGPLNVGSISLETSDIIWFGTYGSGMIRYDADIEKITRYDISNSPLPSNSVCGLLHTDLYLWGASEGMIFRFREGKFEKFPLPVETDITDLTYTRDRGDVIWVGTSDAGLWKFRVPTLSFECAQAGVDMTFSESNDDDKQPCYDLNGRKIVNPEKGTVYIQGGKKMIAR